MSKENLEGRAEKTLRDTDTYRVPVAIDIVAQRLNLTMSAAPLGEKVSGMLVVMGERGAIGYNSPPRRPDHARQPHTVRASACLVAVEFRDNPEPGVGAASALWLTYRHPYKDNRTTDTLPHPPVPPSDFLGVVVRWDRGLGLARRIRKEHRQNVQGYAVKREILRAFPEAQTVN
jgi:hypothetical protein